MNNNPKEIIDLSLKLISLKTTKNQYQEFKKSIDLIKKLIPSKFLKIFYFNKIPTLLIFNQEPQKFFNKGKYYFDILMQGHIDVVEGDEKLFQPKVDKKFIYGRGAVDMKCASALMIVLMKNLIKEKLDKKIGLMLNFDEEVGGDNSAKKFQNKVKGKILINLDGGYGLDLTYGERGFIVFEIETKTPRPHPVNKLWENKGMVDPVWKLSYDILNLHKEFNKKIGIDQTSFGVREINTQKFEGDLRSVYKAVKARCFVSFLREDIEFIKRKIIKAIKYSKINFVLNVEPVKPQDLKNEKLILFRNLLRKYSYKKPKFQIDSGSSDARFFQKNFDLILMSRVDGEGAHNINEKATIKSLEVLYNTLRDFIYNC